MDLLAAPSVGRSHPAVAREAAGAATPTASAIWQDRMTKIPLGKCVRCGIWPDTEFGRCSCAADADRMPLPADHRRSVHDGPYPPPEEWPGFRRESASESVLEADDQPGSQHDIATWFTSLYGQDFVHTPGAGWHYWSGLQWRPDKLDKTRDYIRRLAAALTGGGKQTTARAAQSARFVAGVEQMLRCDPSHARPDSHFDASPDLLGLPLGCAVDLTTGDLLGSDRGRRITRCANHLPIDHDGCPRWLRFLAEATGGDDELIDFLQRWCGYCATGHTSEHALLFVHGPGGSGKSTFAEVLASVLGDYARTAPLDTFTETRGDRHPTDLAGLAAARLAVCSETEEGRAWAESKLKLATGGDTITARFMHRDFFDYRPQFKLLVVGNHLPTLRNADTAMRRRFRVVPFDHPPTNPDRHLKEKLIAEGDAILAWIIDGARLWHKEGLGTAAVIDQATNMYFDDANLVARWLDECTEREPAASEKSSALFGAWKTWCQHNGHNPGNSTTFGRRLAQQGLVKFKSGVNHWRGVTLPGTPQQGQLKDS